MVPKRLVFIFLVLIVAAGIFALWRQDARAPQTVLTEVIAENLDIPWELVFLPDGGMLVTERPGRLLKIDTQKSVIPINGVAHSGEGGLLGVALHPDFKENNYLYLYLTSEVENRLRNRVERYRLTGTELVDRKVIIENIPGALAHDGGRIAFGPDDLLYITTGDAATETNSQNLDTLAGKILRLNDDGSIPADNPFNSPVYSWGHRNPQGLAWDTEGRLWATEHGQSSLDEINLIERGKNYGWPIIRGDAARLGMETPRAHSGEHTTWAPSGAAILNNQLLFAGLRGEALYTADLSGTTLKNITPHFADQFGRLRSVTIGPDNMLYLLTNNRDGRGRPITSDDRIIKIDPASLATGIAE